jgi:hypothetical protein
MTRLTRLRITELEEELGDLDYCRYLGLCDGVEDNTMEDYCILNYQECPRYKKYNETEELRRKLYAQGMSGR